MSNVFEAAASYFKRKPEAKKPPTPDKETPGQERARERLRDLGETNPADEKKAQARMEALTKRRELSMAVDTITRNVVMDESFQTIDKATQLQQYVENIIRNLEPEVQQAFLTKFLEQLHQAHELIAKQSSGASTDSLMSIKRELLNTRKPIDVAMKFPLVPLGLPRQDINNTAHYYRDIRPQIQERAAA